MSLKELVEGECGGTNSLVRLTSHFVQDRSLKDEDYRNPFHQSDPLPSSNADQVIKFNILIPIMLATIYAYFTKSFLLIFKFSSFISHVVNLSKSLFR